MLDLIIDAFVDSAKLIPFLYLAYLLITALNRSNSNKMQQMIRKIGVAGPFVGGCLGVIPQCGFSAAAASLYANRVITMGTMFAIFLSTSDEMLPIMISQLSFGDGKKDEISFVWVLLILGLKLAIAVATGFGIDAFLRAIGRRKEINVSFRPGAVTPAKRSGRGAALRAAGLKTSGADSNQCYDPTCGCGGNLRDPLPLAAGKHCLRTFIYILILTLILNVVIAFVGEDNLKGVFTNIPVVGEIVATLVGMIPNCAASVIITELFMKGVIGLGPTMAGLLANAGVGVMILFQQNRPRKSNFSILAGLYGVGVFWGIMIEIAMKTIS